MDKNFQIITAVSVALIGLYALYSKETTLAAASLGILGGILNAPKAQTQATLTAPVTEKEVAQ